MTRFVGAAEAARHLGVQRATLYAYVSRGLVERRLAVDGRTSLYSLDDLDTLARRGRQRAAAPRPSLDVHIATAITTLDESGPRYRNRDVATLAASASYEQVAELLWTGALPDRVEWPSPDPADRDAAIVAARHGPRSAPSDHGGHARPRCPPPARRRRLLHPPTPGHDPGRARRRRTAADIRPSVAGPAGRRLGSRRTRRAGFDAQASARGDGRSRADDEHDGGPAGRLGAGPAR